MKDKPLMLSLLFGFIAVLIIVCVSFLVNMNKLSASENKFKLENISLSKKANELETQNITLNEEKKSLNDEIAKIKAKLDELNTEYSKLEKLKDKLEENLKDELSKPNIKEKK
jgi:biopolymer transport protein ExbB/TolQ